MSKAYLLGNRFSEDIDIAITSDPQRTDNQTKNIISRISKVMSAGLEEVPNPATRKYSKYRKAFYRYPVTTENGIIGAINPGQILLEIVLSKSLSLSKGIHQEFSHRVSGEQGQKRHNRGIWNAGI